MSLKSLRIIDASDVKNNLNFQKFFVDNTKITKKIGKKKDISDYFIKEIEFLKTTGVHIPEGIVLHENFYSLNKSRIIENHKLFNHILKHLTKR